MALLPLILGLLFWAPEALRAETPNITAITDRLIAAYPTFLARREGNALVWRDGKRMAIDDGLGPKSPAARLDAPDLKDMLAQPYPLGAAPPPARDVDPGRARNGEFFTAMYGDCRRDEVRRNLAPVVWLPKKWGKTLQVTRVNGVAGRLAAVSAELDGLPARFDVYLYPPAGTYNCRAIAGTERVSPHGLGIAIDISTKESDYWRWGKPGADGSYAFRNRIPQEIVVIFEKHGFIWGGKWYHYDTMHFEYRPELLLAR
ncbi:MAG: M15 family metallopeptidase [Hyphomicrobium sp.]|nr:M15 family metallopeptidase [Hyphomicrobium sp.]